MRIAIVSTEGGFWYVRRVRTVEHDLSADEKVYRCDKHLGGPFLTLDEAAKCGADVEESQEQK
jgi:hypothetical protein